MLLSRRVGVSNKKAGISLHSKGKNWAFKRSETCFFGIKLAYSAELGMGETMANWILLISGGPIRDMDVFGRWISGKR